MANSKYQAAIDVANKELDELRKKRKEKNINVQSNKSTSDSTENAWEKSDYADAIRQAEQDLKSKSAEKTVNNLNSSIPIKSDTIHHAGRSFEENYIASRQKAIQEEQKKGNNFVDGLNYFVDNTNKSQISDNSNIPKGIKNKTNLLHSVVPDLTPKTAAKAEEANNEKQEKSTDEIKQDEKFVLNDPILSRLEYISEMNSAGVDTALDSAKNTVGALASQSRSFLNKLFGGKKIKSKYLSNTYGKGKYTSVASPIKEQTKPTLRSYSDILENGLETDTTQFAKAESESYKTLLDELNKYASENADKVEKIQHKFSENDIGTVTNVIGNIAYSFGYGTPAQIARIFTPAAASVLMGTQEFSNAYSRAKNQYGYNDEQALKYASEDAVWAGLGQLSVGQFGQGALDKKIAKVVSSISNPYARAGVDVAITVGADAIEEVADEIIDIAIRKNIGDENAKFNTKDIGTAALYGGATSALFGIASMPGKVRSYKVDNDIINTYANYVKKVSNNKEADTLFEIGELLKDRADKIINNPESSREDIVRAEYLKDGIEEVGETLANYADRIEINTTQDVDNAITQITDFTYEEPEISAVTLVEAVAKNAKTDENVVNKTVDTLHDKISEIKETKKNVQDESEKKKLDEQEKALKKVDEAVRSNRDELESIAEQAKEAAQNDNEKNTNKPVSIVEQAYNKVESGDKELVAEGFDDIIKNTLSKLPENTSFDNAFRKVSNVLTYHLNEIGNRIANNQSESKTGTAENIADVYLKISQENHVKQLYDDINLEKKNLGSDDDTAQSSMDKLSKEFSEKISEIEASDTTDLEQKINDIADEYAEKYVTETLDKVKVDYKSDDDYNRKKDVLNYIKSKTFVTPEEVKSEIPDWSTYRKKNSFLVHFTDDRTKPNVFGVDEIWSEASELYPEYFDSSITDRTKMVETLVDVANSLTDKNLKQESSKAAENDNKIYVNDVKTKLIDSVKHQIDEKKQGLPEYGESSETELPISTAKGTKEQTLNSDFVESKQPDIYATESKANTTVETPKSIDSNANVSSTDDVPAARKQFDVTYKSTNNTKTGEPLDVFVIDKSLSDDEYSRLKKAFGKIGGYYSRYAKGFIVPADKSDSDSQKAIEMVSEFANVNGVTKKETSLVENKVDTPESTSNATTQLSETKETVEKKHPISKEEADKLIGKHLTMDDHEFKIESVGRISRDVSMLDLSAIYPINRVEKYETVVKILAEQESTNNTTTNTVVVDTTEEIVNRQQALENGVEPDARPDVSTAVPSVGNGVSTETVSADSIENTFYSKIADKIVADYLETSTVLGSTGLLRIASKIYGGTLAEGTFDVKDATDSLELAVNRYLLKEMSERADEFNSNNALNAKRGIQWMEALLSRIPTQTKRTEEMVQLQQFSTPPNIAYLANWVANIGSNDFMLEPSAGIGGLATFAKAFGATTCVNEISKRRLGALRSLGFDHVTSEDGSQLNNILPDYIRPTVVVMNPPFSSTAGRTKNSTKNAIPHVEQALYRLEEGGRLVAILGQGMSNDAPTFAKWWDSIRSQGYDIRANIGIDGSNYRKYGTTFNVRLVVIDKTGNNGNTITGDYQNLGDIPELLEGIRNDRRNERKDNGAVGGRIDSRNGQTYSRGAESNRAVSDVKTSDESKLSGGTRTDTGSGDGRVSDGNDKRPTRVEDKQVYRGTSEESNGSVRGPEAESAISVPVMDDAQSKRDMRDGNGRMPSGLGTSRNVDYGTAGRMDSGDIVPANAGNNGGMVQTGTGVPGTSVKETETKSKKQVAKKPKAKKANVSDDGVYAEYVPSKLTLKNAQPHAAKIVESSAMAAVSAPTLTYKPNLDQSIVDKGLLSGLQLENVTYAGQAHLDMLLNGYRKGFFVGDGTGVGKGRQAAGIILDNFNQGRRKALWISVTQDLMEDAKRDWGDLGGDTNLIFNKDALEKILKKGGNVSQEGILFTTYTTLGTKPKAGSKKKSNLEIISEWLGKDFDGVIIYDEAHKMNNLIPTKGKRGQQNAAVSAIAADNIQEMFPKARVVYMSATGASEVKDLCFASRLGIWGEGTPFVDAKDFVDKIGAAGISAMEMVASSLKSTGVYQARSISYEGVKYSSLKHTLTKDQQVMYDTFCDAWQVVYQNMERALAATHTTKNARSAFYGAQQNFFNQVLTSMSIPSVIADMKKKLDKGEACVLQLVNTNASQTEQELEKTKSEGKDLEDIDITPRGALLGFLENAFPIEQYEEILDEKGNKSYRRVVDSNGNPVINRQAVGMRDELIERVKEMSIPQGPLDMIIETFGADKVAEVTGRTKRIITKTDENGSQTKIVEAIAQPSFRMAEVKAFQDDKKQILIFSAAGSTGVSFHADRRVKNQRHRNHYVVQPGFNAKGAVQGFGRDLRTNMADIPEYILCTTNVAGQARFTSTIARRLDQLGALTKGQRQTGSGIFGEKDNLESPLSVTAMHEFLKNLGQNRVPGINGKAVFTKLGLQKKLYDKDSNAFKTSAVNEIEMSTFLNRMLALKVDEQNIVFGEFENLRQKMYDDAIESGTLDMGIANIKAEKISVQQEETIYSDAKTGAEATYIKAIAYKKPVTIETVEDAKVYRNAFVKLVKLDDDSVRAVYRIADQTDELGRVQKKYVLQSPNTADFKRWNETTVKNKTTDIPMEQWESAWASELANVPEYNESVLHIVSGTLLPVWNKFPQDGTVKLLKIVTDTGESILGRQIPPDKIESVLRDFGLNQIKETYTGSQIFDAVTKNKTVFEFTQSYGGKNQIKRSRVANENRIEITGKNLWAIKTNFDGVFEETIKGEKRYFVPANDKGKKILDAINEKYTVSKASDSSESSSGLFYAKVNGKWSNGDGNDGDVKTLTDIRKDVEARFGIEINTGNVGSSEAGVYNTHSGSIRTRVTNDLPTIAHEVGHHLDTKYKLHEMTSVNELIGHYRVELEEAGYNESLFPYEAIAYYFADLANNAESTEKLFPGFTNDLRDSLNERDMKALSEFVNETNTYFSADRIRRRNASIHFRHKDNSLAGQAQFEVDTFLKNPGVYTKRLSRKFIHAVFDDIIELERFGKAHDLAFKERAATSIVDGRIHYAFTDNSGKVIGQALETILIDGNINAQNYKDFEAYLVARVALDRIEASEEDPSIRNLVYADDELQNKDNIIADIMKYETDNPSFEKTAEGIYGYKNNLLDISVDSGIISKELADNLKSTFPHYVPLYRVMDKGDSNPRSGRGQKTPGSTIMRFKGSGRDIYSPIENLIKQTESVTKAILQNEVRKEVFDAIDKEADMGEWAEKISEKKFYDVVDTADVKARVSMFDSDKLAVLSPDERNELFDELMQTIGATTGVWKKANNQGENVVSVMRKGKAVYYEIHDDGLMNALVSLRYSPSQTNIFMKAITTAKNTFVTLTTGSNPVFGYTNMARDLQTGYIYSTTQNNPFKYAVEWVRAFAEAIRNSDDYKKFRANGGGYAGSFAVNANLKKNYKSLISGLNRRTIFTPIKFILGKIGDAIESVETASRYAENKRQLKKGGDALDALRASQNITINFQQGGSVTKQINQFVPFFNAGIQGLYQNVTRIAKSSKKERTMILAKLAGCAMVMALIESAIHNFAKRNEDDEKAQEAYARLSTYNKFANWNFYVGDGKFIRIAKEKTLMIPSTMLSALYDKLANDNEAAFQGMSEYVIDALFPVTADTMGDVIILGTVFDLLKNETFTGAPIVPTAHQYRNAPEQYNEKTSSVAVYLGAKLNMSPMQIDYIIDDNFGFVGDLITNLTINSGNILDNTKDYLSSTAQGMFMRDSVYSTDIISIFYDTREKYEKNANSYKATNGMNDKYSFYDTYGKYKYDKVADLYSKVNNTIKADSDTESARETRYYLNTIIKTVNETEITQLDKDVAELALETNSEIKDIAPYIVVPEELKYAGKTIHKLTGEEMMSYYTESQILFEDMYEKILSAGFDADQTAEALALIKKEIKSAMDDIYLSNYIKSIK